MLNQPNQPWVLLRSSMCQHLWPWPANLPLPGRLLPRPLSLLPPPPAPLSPAPRTAGWLRRGSPRFLLTADFDETIVDENSDDSIVRVAPGQRLPGEPACHLPRASTTSTCSASSSTLGDQGVRPRDLRAVYGDPSRYRPAWANCCSLWPSRVPALRLFSSQAPTPLAWRARCRRGHQGCSVASSATLPGRPFGGCWRCGPSTHTAARAAPPTCASTRCSATTCEAGARRRALPSAFLRGAARPTTSVPMGLLAGGDVAFPARGYPMHRLIRRHRG